MHRSISAFECLYAKRKTAIANIAAGRRTAWVPDNENVLMFGS